MNVKYKESVKELPVGDFIMELKREEILAAARRAGYDFGEKLSKKRLAERLAQVYEFFPAIVRKSLSEEARERIAVMAQSGFEALENAPGISELRSIGMVALLDGGEEQEQRLAVISKKLAESLADDGEINNKENRGE